MRLLFIASVCILHEHVYENATGSRGRYEMIYAVTYVGPRHLETVWISACLQSLRVVVVAVAHKASGWVPPAEKQKNVTSGLESKTACYGQVKKL